MKAGSGKGFIYLDRVLRDSWLWDANDFDFVVAIKLIMVANFKPGEFEGTVVPRGGLVRSIASLTRDLGGQATTKKVRLSLRKLTTAKYLSVESKQGKRFSLITILNYERYQSSDDASDGSEGELGANFGRTSGEKRATIEERKKGRKKEEPMSEVKTSDEPLPSPRPVKPPPEKALNAAEYLRRKIIRADPGSKLAKTFAASKHSSWAKVLDLLNRKDGQSWEDIRAAIDWLFDTENTFVVLSPASLREKFDPIRHHMGKSRKVRTRPMAAPQPMRPKDETPEGFRERVAREKAEARQ